ncbi:MAG: hypothetical protein AAB115_05485 [Pseudomonadota bacterium]|mgnify:FL=1
MPAYWIARSKINDPVEYKKYTDRAGGAAVITGRIETRIEKKQRITRPWNSWLSRQRRLEKIAPMLLPCVVIEYHRGWGI